MIQNRAMFYFLRDIDMDRIIPSSGHPITRHQNETGEPLWIVSNASFSLNRCKPFTGKDLTELEWDENEVTIDGLDNVEDLLKETLGILKQWKHQMETDFPLDKFDIILSIDYGDEDVEPSATIRFYAIRDHYRIVEINQMNLENFVQPILVECVGC